LTLREHPGPAITRPGGCRGTVLFRTRPHIDQAGPEWQDIARYHVIRERVAGYRAEVEAAGLDWSAAPVEERSPSGQNAGWWGRRRAANRPRRG